MRKTRLTEILPAVLMMCVFAAVFLIGTPENARAQSTQRSVEGRVTNGQDQIQEKAVVFLKDIHSLAIKSVTTGKDGVFHFMQLSSTNDYAVWAELDGKKSNVKTISSFDTRKTFVIALKIK